MAQAGGPRERRVAFVAIPDTAFRRSGMTEAQMHETFSREACQIAAPIPKRGCPKL
jgi:hypothetical protein